MADRIVVMNAGRIEQIGTPLQLYDTPANLFVADFIGSPSMNVIRGVLGGAGNAVHVELPDGTQLPVPSLVSGKPGQKVVFGIRPEHTQLADSSGVAVMVDVVEPTGAHIQVYTKLAGVPFCAIFTERHDFAPGQTIHLAFPAGKTHLFDAESGQRL